MKSTLFLRLAILATLLLIGPVHADSTVDFPKAALRGYGAVSGTFTVTDAKDQSGSVLAIDCENEEKAELLQAKFISDEQVLPGVNKISIDAKQWGLGSLRFGGVPVTACEVKDQGFLAAIRLGAKVFLVAAPTRDGLVALIDKSVAGSSGAIVSESTTVVPMWLDRFDQHGFRFYYSTGMIPEKATAETYHFRGDFTFARNHGVGMVFWDNLSDILGADGQTDDAHWDWAEGLARLNDLPTAINLSASNFGIPTWVANRFREDGLMLAMPGYLGDSMSVANWRGTEPKCGELAWGVTPARDAMLRALQESVRHFDSHSNVVSWMEPLNELSQGGGRLHGLRPWSGHDVPRIPAR